MSERSITPQDYGIESAASPAPASALTWQPKEYSRVEPGRYEAVAIRFQGPQWVRTFGRWSMIIEFELLESSTKVCAFYDFGRNPEAPRIAERGYYFRDWCKANGGKPRSGDKMSPEIFLGRTFAVEVRDCESGAYSIVSGIESTEATKEISTQAFNHASTSTFKAFKQESFKQPSISTIEAFKQLSTQATKEAITQAPKQLSTQASKELSPTEAESSRDGMFTI